MDFFVLIKKKTLTLGVPIKSQENTIGSQSPVQKQNPSFSQIDLSIAGNGDTVD